MPPDARVPLNPEQCARVAALFQVDMLVQPSSDRCFADSEYVAQGVPLSADIADCDVLMGVKEVPIDQLLPGKTYLFFSHTIKKQSYNRKLLRAVLEKKIRLIDYEVMTDEEGQRLVAFGKFAGMVGAHNGILAYGQRTGTFELPRMKDCHDYEAAKAIYAHTHLPAMKVVLTGSGRVANGAAQVLRDMGLAQVSPEDFLTQVYDQAVFTQLSWPHYAARRDGRDMGSKDFYLHPSDYRSIFGPYTRIADVMINGIFWDDRAPAFFTAECMAEPDFHIQVISDVTCDIAPLSSVPSTLYASSIAEPFFGYDPRTRAITPPFQPSAIDMTTIDNLPSEMPRDASTAFGEQFIAHILPEMLKPDSPVIERATIAADGELMQRFLYLEDYVNAPV